MICLVLKLNYNSNKLEGYTQLFSITQMNSLFASLDKSKENKLPYGLGTSEESKVKLKFNTILVWVKSICRLKQTKTAESRH